MTIINSVPFREIFDIYLNVCSDKPAIVSELHSLLSRHKNHTILDCSVGTGFAILDLVKDGLNIVCADGSNEMLRKFSQNANNMDLRKSALHLDWKELGAVFSGVFDVVICRGNSLAYADMWDAECRPDGLSSIKKALTNMVQCIKPGGHFYVDIPSDESTGKSLEISHPVKLINGLKVSVNERIFLLPGSQVRKWDVEMNIDGLRTQFSRYSHAIGEENLIKTMKDIGLLDVKMIDMPGGRKHYAFFSGRRGECNDQRPEAEMQWDQGAASGAALSHM